MPGVDIVGNMIYRIGHSIFLPRGPSPTPPMVTSAFHPAVFTSTTTYDRQTMGQRTRDYDRRSGVRILCGGWVTVLLLVEGVHTSVIFASIC